jgi:hypothetical protein
MFEKVGLIAERVATNTSRRAFLGGIGNAAFGLAAAAAGLLALRGEAAAGNGCPPGYRKSSCGHGFSMCCPAGTHCTDGADGIHYCAAHYPPGQV